MSECGNRCNSLVGPSLWNTEEKRAETSFMSSHFVGFSDLNKSIAAFKQRQHFPRHNSKTHFLAITMAILSVRDDSRLTNAAAPFRFGPHIRWGAG
jgi:hypothetical protein